MNYAFMTFSCPDLGWADVLALAKRYGYDGVEPRICAKHGHGIEWDADAASLDAAKQAAADAGIAIACIATSCKLADAETNQQQVEDARRSIHLAGDAGAPCIRVFGGQYGDLSRAEAMDVLVRSLSVLAEQADARGVTICLETHDAWCDPKHVAEVIARVDHPAVAVNWDIMHPVRVAGATMDEAFEALGPYIRHVHFHDGVTNDGKLEMVPIGHGDVDHERAVRLLKGMGYAGALSGEWINWQPADEHLPRELATMKHYESLP